MVLEICSHWSKQVQDKVILFNSNPALDTFEEKMEVCDAVGPGDCDEDPEVHMANQHISAICPVSGTCSLFGCQSDCANCNTVAPALTDKTENSLQVSFSP